MKKMKNSDRKSGPTKWIALTAGDHSAYAVSLGELDSSSNPGTRISPVEGSQLVHHENWTTHLYF